MAEQNVNAEGRERQMVLFQMVVIIIRRSRIRLVHLLGGHEEYQQLLDYVVDVAVELIRVGQLPLSAEGQLTVNNLFNYLFEVMDYITDLLD